ncbi:MAG: hypothetical protein JWM82_1931 [Myxococcales bacterium]|nr:hypothetical protein [Myxococcales bacterium]
MYYKIILPRWIRVAFVLGASVVVAPGVARAAITYINDNTVAATTATQSSVTGTLTGVTAGDFLVAIVTTDQTATITKPAAWTDPGVRADSGASMSVAIYTYPSTPSTGTVSATFSFSAADGAGIVQLIDLRGVLPESPIDVTATASGHANSATLTASSATTSAGDIAIIGWSNDSTTRTFGNPVAPWTLVNADVQSRSTDEQGVYQTDIGNATTLTETLSISRTSYWAAVMLTLKAAPLYWRGGLTGCASGSAFTSTTCWSTTSGGASSGGAPTTTDLVVFDGHATGNCALSSTATTSVYSMTTTSAYTGTITMGTQNVSLKGGLTLNGGTFTGSSGKTLATNQSGTYLGSLVVAGGAFNGNGALVNVRSLTVSSGAFTQGAGAFSTNNGGTATFSGGTSTFAAGTSAFVSTLTTSGTASVTFGAGAPTVSGLATFGGGTIAFGSGRLLLNGGLDLEGATVTLGAAASSTSVTGTVTVGSGALNLANGAASPDFTCTGVFTQSGGTVNVNGAATTLGTGNTSGDTFVMSAGAFNNTIAGGSVSIGSSGGGGGDTNISGATALYTSTATETFNGALTIAGTMSLGAATMAGGDLVTISSGGTMTLSSSGFSFPSTTGMTLDGTLNAGTGTVAFAGSVTLTGTLNGASGTQTFARAVTVSGTLSTGNASMTGTTAGRKLVTISSGGTMTLSSSGFVFNSTSTMPIAGTLDTAGAVSFAGPVTLSGTLNGGGTLSFADDVALSGTFNANAATTSFGSTGTVTMSSGSTFNGDTGTTTFGAAPTLTAGTFSVGAHGSTGSVIFSAGATFATGMTLAFPTSGGKLQLPGGQTLTLNGTVTSRAGTATTLPQISRSAGTTGITVAFAAGTLDVDGLELKNVISTGVTIASGVTYTLVSHLKFTNNVAAGAAGSRHLVITATSTVVNLAGCTFDTTAAANVRLLGATSAARAHAVLEFQSAAVNGSGAGESLDDDADNLDAAPTDNNATDTTTSPYYGSVVEWTYASPSDTAGTAVGAPVAAFDFNTFAFYGVYVSFKNISGASTADRLWMRNADGSAAYSFDVPNASGDIVGNPRFDTLNEVTAGLDVNGDGDALDTDVRVVYIGTSLGHIIKLIDNGTSLAQPASGAWATDFAVPASVKTITSPLASDYTNLYFGGTDAASATKIFGVQISGGANEKTLQKTVASAGAVTTAPTWTVVSGSTYLFVGSGVSAGKAHVYRVQVSPGALVDADFNSATTTTAFNGGINLVSSRAYAVNDGGKLYVLDASSFGTGGFTTLTGYPYSSAAASPIKAFPFVDSFSSYAYFGDNSGKLYVVTLAGANLTGYPYALTGAPQLTSTPLYRRAGGTIAVGASDGYVYFINRHDAANAPQIRKRYFVGAGSVSSVSYNSNSSQYMAASSDGRMTFINVADVGADTDGVE